MEIPPGDADVSVPSILGKIYMQTILTCECNEQVIEVNRFGTRSVGRSVDQFPVNLLT